MAARKTPAVKAEVPKEIEGDNYWVVYDYNNYDFTSFGTQEDAMKWASEECSMNTFVYRIYARTKNTIELVTV